MEKHIIWKPYKLLIDPKFGRKPTLQPTWKDLQGGPLSLLAALLIELELSLSHFYQMSEYRCTARVWQRRTVLL